MFVTLLILSYIISVSNSLPSETLVSIATYDFIIVGGGTAGLTLASRLSESPKVRVAVVEAGGHYERDSGNNSVVPGLAAYGANPDPSTANATPLIDWGFVTAPMAGLNGRTLYYARGKTLGGTSARNYMMYVLVSIKRVAHEMLSFMKIPAWDQRDLRPMGENGRGLFLWIPKTASILSQERTLLSTQYSPSCCKCQCARSQHRCL